MSKLTTHILLIREFETEGYGLYGHEVRRPRFWAEHNEDPYAIPRAIDESVVAIANKLKFTAEELFLFMDSKLGRWVGDEIMYPKFNKDRVEIILEKYMKQFLKEAR
jgi:hypothetical protein